jgi:hypothetical protein
MNTATTRTTTADVDSVWDVLADGWNYASWVVGASRIRAVDATWPEVGSAIHHSVGVWPAVLNDETRVLSVHPGRELRLRARALPFGAAEIVMRLTPLAVGCRVDMIEHALSFPFRLIPPSLQHAAVFPRNTEALRRLTLLAEGRD